MADRENVLYIKTLAGFSIRYNGAEVAAGKLGASQICQLLLLIIHHKDTQSCSTMEMGLEYSLSVF